MLWKDFGITYKDLETSDKISIFSIIAKLFHLVVFEEGIHLLSI